MYVNNRFWCLTALDNDFIINPLILSVVYYISIISSLEVAFYNKHDVHKNEHKT